MCGDICAARFSPGKRAGKRASGQQKARAKAGGRASGQQKARAKAGLMLGYGGALRSAP